MSFSILYVAADIRVCKKHRIASMKVLKLFHDPLDLVEIAFLLKNCSECNKNQHSLDITKLAAFPC